MKKVSLIFLVFTTFFINTGSYAQETAVLESEEVLMNCYEDGTCVSVKDNGTDSSIKGKMATTSTTMPPLQLTRLNFAVKNNNQPVSERCVGLPVTLQTTVNGTTTTETHTFWSMPTDIWGKISIIMAHSGVTNTCSNGTSYKMWFSTQGLSVETPVNDWPMGCCQITLNCGMKFCYSAPNIYGYAECLCDKLDKIFRCLGIGFTEWHEGSTCNYQTGLCETNTLIELSQFDALPGNKSVTVVWSTEAEIDTLGFNIYRSDSRDGEYLMINDSIIPARGNSFSGDSYEFIDQSVQNRKTYYYLLEDVEFSGRTERHGPVSATPKYLYRFIEP